jgi:hypothetical protein
LDAVCCGAFGRFWHLADADRSKRGFEVMFRAYAPTKAFFDKMWKLPDIEKVAQ